LRSRRIPVSKEEKIAIRLSDIVNDYTLNLDEVGRHFFRVAPQVSYNRILEIVEIAEHEKEATNDRRHHNPLF
jgi:hypothetical protein